MCKVSLNTVEKVKKFVNVVSKMDVDAFLTSGRYVIDAKSIMGILSLDLTKPIEISFESKEGITEDKVKECMGAIAEFVVE